ncbi:MAG TPA: glycosyltransferase family 1 protein [Methanomicrobia archaeon]|nr:glycosyltransferase family 1 protein [Methanomicrobia archaeon]
MKIATIVLGDIDALTGGYLYMRKAVEYLRAHGVETEVVRIPALPVPYLLHLCSTIALCFRFPWRRYAVVLEDEMAHPALCLFNHWLTVTTQTKIVVIVHMLWWKAARNSLKARYVRFIETHVLKTADRVIANSHHTKAELETMGIPGASITVIHPGCDLPLSGTRAPDPREARDRTTLQLLTVANITPLKGLDTLIEALARLNDPALTLDIIGDEHREPRYSQRLKARVTRYGLENRVRFHGQQPPDKLASYYADADIFVLPSLCEAFGIVVAEAMAFGLPIVATRCGGIPELVTDGENGFLVPPNDSASLADAIQKLAADPTLRDHCGRRSYEKTRNLNTWDECGKQIFTVLAAIRGERRG